MIQTQLRVERRVSVKTKQSAGRATLIESSQRHRIKGNATSSRRRPAEQCVRVCVRVAESASHRVASETPTRFQARARALM